MTSHGIGNAGLGVSLILPLLGKLRTCMRSLTTARDADRHPFHYVVPQCAEIGEKR